MSRVERHKNEYSKADRKAVEDLKPSEDPADISFKYGKKETEAESEAFVKRGTDTEVHRKGRAARGRADENADMGVLDQTDEEKARARKEARAMGDGRPEFHGNRVLGGFIKFIGTIILLAAVIACLALFVPHYAGIDRYAVSNGSMEPSISEGSIIYTAQTEPSTLSEGDVIVFRSKDSDGTPVVHRVAENRIADGEVITKGDADKQNNPDPVLYSDILGKKVISVPMLGYLAAPMDTVMGKVAMGLVIIGAYLLTVIGSRIRKG